MPPVTSPSAPLIPPDNGVTVRMYRIGHGDCFLLAFPGQQQDKPSYVLIDCGYKPGSPQHINTTIAEITANIRQATGGHIHVAIITHEHQDHVNGITETRFQNITIGQTWLAWTEDPEDGVANGLREKYNDELLGLLAARRQLAVGDEEQAKRLEAFLEFEFGGDDESFDANAAAGLLGAAGGVSANKKSMKLFKDRASGGVKCIRPHEEILTIPGAKGVRVFALGPPRDPDRLRDLNPQAGEQFHPLALASVSAGNFFGAAARAPAGHGTSPFARRYALELKQALGDDRFGKFFREHYGGQGTATVYSPATTQQDDEVPDNPDWRRIDREWLYSAEQLALDMNKYTNNASLVLAFEVGGKGGKVLLFAADAQRGNWVSWAKKEWTDGDKKVTARDLLARTVLYKVGHHGSHNATLNGTEQDESPNLAWMAKGEHQREFTAMITAVRAWAETQNGWDHPLKEIKDALLKKAAGRVFQTDTDFTKMKMPEGASQADWDRFEARTDYDRLYFDYKITH